MVLALGTGLSFAATSAVLALVLGVVVFVAIGALSHEHERAFSSAMIYLLLGLIVAAVVEVFGLSWFGLLQDPRVLQHVAEVTLIFALFATGLRIARFTRTRSIAVLLLLGVVMTVTVAAVAAFAVLFMGLSLGGRRSAASRGDRYRRLDRGGRGHYLYPVSRSHRNRLTQPTVHPSLSPIHFRTYRRGYQWGRSRHLGSAV